MLTIDINNAFFALGSGFTVRLVWENPACYMDKNPGDIALGISIPVNDINRAILGSPDRFQKYYSGGNSSAGVRFPGCSARFGGWLLNNGSLVVTSANDETYECWIQGELGVMAETTREKNITDFPWLASQTFNNKEVDEYDDETDHYCPLTIKNRGFWDGMGAEFDVRSAYIDQYGKIQYREEKMARLQKQHFDNFSWKVNSPVTASPYVIATTDPGCVVSPYLYMRYVIKELLRMNGFYIKTNQMYPEDLSATSREKNLMVYNNFNILRAVWDTQQVYTQEWSEERQELIDVSSTAVTNVLWDVTQFNYADLLPKISMKDFFLGIQNSLNYIFRFRNDGKVDIIDRNALPLSEAIDLQNYISGVWSMGEKISRRLKFDMQFDKDDKLFADDYEDLSDRLADFGEPVIDFDDLANILAPEIGELRLATKPNKIYEYKWKVASDENAGFIEDQIDTIGWDFVSNGWQPFVVNPENETEEVIKVPLTGLFNDDLLGLNYDTVVQKGNLHQMRSTWSDFTFRAIVANWVHVPDRMAWTGETGLYETRWKNWLQFWAGRQEVSASFRMPLNVLVYVINNITSKFRTDDGEFYIREIECEFGIDEIGQVKIKGFKN